jgi:hypothetical protein
MVEGQEKTKTRLEIEPPMKGVLGLEFSTSMRWERTKVIVESRCPTPPEYLRSACAPCFPPA